MHSYLVSNPGDTSLVCHVHSRVHLLSLFVDESMAVQVSETVAPMTVTLLTTMTPRVTHPMTE